MPRALPSAKEGEERHLLMPELGGWTVVADDSESGLHSHPELAGASPSHDGQNQPPPRATHSSSSAATAWPRQRRRPRAAPGLHAAAEVQDGPGRSVPPGPWTDFALDYVGPGPLAEDTLD